MTHIYASYHANKKCTIRKSRMISSFKDSLVGGPLEARSLRPNTNRPHKNEKFTPKGATRSSNSHPNTNWPLKNEKFTLKGPLD